MLICTKNNRKDAEDNRPIASEMKMERGNLPLYINRLFRRFAPQS